MQSDRFLGFEFHVTLLYWIHYLKGYFLRMDLILNLENGLEQKLSKFLGMIIKRIGLLTT